MSSCDSICITEWIFLFLWFVSVPVYCIYTIWKYRKTKFKEEFWALAMALFPADMLLLCQHMWAYKMATWGLLPSALMRAPKVVGWLVMVPKLAFTAAQAMGVMFLSLNRYMAILKPAVYSTLWNRKVTIMCICAQWAAAIVVVLCLAQVRFDLVPNHGNNDSGFSAVPEKRDKKMASIVLGIVFGFGGLVRIVLFAILYGRMFYYVYKQNRMVGAAARRSGDQRSHRAEYNLVIIGALLVLCDMSSTTHILDVAIHMDQVNDKMRFLTFRGACLSDIYGWLNGWLMLFLSTKVRKQFLEQYRCVKSN